MVGVTVDTAILAGIIEAEINACHAAAFQALVFVFDCIDRTADRYTISWHAEQFDYIARKLCRHTDKVTISFIDLYRNITGSNLSISGRGFLLQKTIQSTSSGLRLMLLT